MWSLMKMGSSPAGALTQRILSEVVDLNNFLRRFQLSEHFEVKRRQLGNSFVPLSANTYTDLSIRNGEIGLWVGDSFKDVRYYSDEEEMAAILRSSLKIVITKTHRNMSTEEVVEDIMRITGIALQIGGIPRDAAGIMNMLSEVDATRSQIYELANNNQLEWIRGFGEPQSPKEYKKNMNAAMARYLKEE